ncbi:MAG: hypothetical protein U9N38_05555 [Thermodesulfobacteriota bacterium]|nr:hypothetical protein [Thermodesulfobacteriota bacterium]
MKYYIRITIAVFTTLILIIPGTVLAAKNTSSPDLPTVTKQLAPNIAATQQAQTTPQTDIATMEDIRDIKGPFSIPWPWWWAVYTGGGIILLLLVWGIWKLTKRSRALRIKLAFETAFEQLESARALMVPGKGEAFSIAVSDAIRVYIEERFDLGTTRRTTEEFMRQLTTENKNSLGNCRDELQRFLTHCDLAKFARYALSIEQMGAMHSSAWQFVEQTKPVQEKTPDSTGDTL